MALPLSKLGRRYGRKTPAPLPEHRMLSRAALTIPSTVDLRAWAGPVKDQGEEGSCTAHAGASAMEWIFRRYLKKSPVLSPQYLYAQELLAQGNFPQDSGSDGVTLCETMISKGCCEESLYPYVAGKIAKPSPEQIANAAEYRLGAYHGLTGSKVALTVLGDPTPWPIEIGFTVFESFESAAVAKTGIMPVPERGERKEGGHEVLLLGHDVSVTPVLRPAGCPPAVLAQNSWDTDWGLDGFFWMPLEILDAPDTDLKIAHAGHPWV